MVTDDVGDGRVIAAAGAAKADIIISGGRHLRALGTFQRIDILVPAEALARIGR